MVVPRAADRLSGDLRGVLPRHEGGIEHMIGPAPDDEWLLVRHALRERTGPEGVRKERCQDDREPCQNDTRWRRQAADV
jgi:hypothetical protein